MIGSIDVSEKHKRHTDFQKQQPLSRILIFSRLDSLVLFKTKTWLTIYWHTVDIERSRNKKADLVPKKLALQIESSSVLVQQPFSNNDKSNMKKENKYTP